MFLNRLPLRNQQFGIGQSTKYIALPPIYLSESQGERTDETNRAIIRLLQLDGRRAYADMAKEVACPRRPFGNAVRRLLDSEVIQIVAVTDQIQMGYPRAAMIAINVDGDVQAAAERIADIDEVDYLVSTAGGIDLLAEVFASHDEHLYELLNRIRAVQGVRQAQTYMYFKIHKQTYQWGVK